jgi:hypothetical protein
MERGKIDRVIESLIAHGVDNDTVIYIGQEAAFMPDVIEEWPEIVPLPNEMKKNYLGRLVKVHDKDT